MSGSGGQREEEEHENSRLRKLFIYMCTVLPSTVLDSLVTFSHTQLLLLIQPCYAIFKTAFSLVHLFCIALVLVSYQGWPIRSSAATPETRMPDRHINTIASPCLIALS